ncbi:hypothetical protein TNCV_2493031 [Trichonephila clavipes]|uniref:Uncharacterized protein n=1 Tax=Trichonephila clavipes TaxID=2585209 RepID=A0A8X6V8T4_TRICX|nr:hypothetical protein TNCV_2493031 [Trichonephila clavipes]
MYRQRFTTIHHHYSLGQKAAAGPADLCSCPQNNSSWQGASCTPVVGRKFEHHTGYSTLFHSNFEGEHTRSGQRPPTSLLLPQTSPRVAKQCEVNIHSLAPPTSREDIQLDGYLSTPMPQKHSTFTNIHAFSGIRTQALRLRSQHH